MPLTGLAQLLLLLFLACAAAASTALFFSVFLHPILALPVTAIFLLFPFAAEMGNMYLPQFLFPVFSVLRVVLNFTFQRPGTAGLGPIAIAATVQAIGFWLAASALFARRDVTVTAE